MTVTNTEEDNKLFVYYVLVYEKIVHELSLAWQIIAQKVLKIVDALAFCRHLEYARETL